MNDRNLYYSITVIFLPIGQIQLLTYTFPNDVILHFQGGYAGNAAGMKISSLHKLSDIRSNKPGLNLLHYVANQAQETQPELLTLPDDLAILEEASK